MYSEIVPIFSLLWWKYTTIFLLSFTVLLILAKTKYKILIANALGFYMLFDIFFIQWYRYSLGSWTIDVSLPLQYCNVMAIVASIAYLTRWMWAFELVLFLGVVAPLQAIVTPGFAFSHYSFVVTYYITHGATIAAPFFLMLGFGLRIRVHSWWKIAISFAIFLIPIMTFNYLTKSNYMFLMHPPALSNPLIAGRWPYYVLNWILGLLIASLLIYVVFPRDRRNDNLPR